MIFIASFAERSRTAKVVAGTVLAVLSPGIAAAQPTSPPPVTILTSSPFAGHGDIFITPTGDASTYANGPEIIDQQGNLGTQERLDTIERLVSARELLSLGEIEQYKPNEQVSAQRETWRAEYLERILRVVHHELESAEQDETPASYESALKLVSSS